MENNKRLLYFGFYDDTVSLLLDNPSEELVSYIKRFYELKNYLKLRYDVVVLEVIYTVDLISFDEWKTEEWLQYHLDNMDYTGEKLEIVKKILSYERKC